MNNNIDAKFFIEHFVEIESYMLQAFTPWEYNFYIDCLENHTVLTPKQQSLLLQIAEKYKGVFQRVTKL